MDKEDEVYTYTCTYMHTHTHTHKQMENGRLHSHKKGRNFAICNNMDRHGG